MTRVRRVLRSIGTAAIAVGLGALLYVGLVLARTNPTEPAPPAGRTLTLVDAPFEAPTTRVVGDSLGQIRIERLGVVAEIREGETDAVLRRGVGHLADTPWLGDDGNMALAGHRDTVFRGLRQIVVGDVIEIVTADRSAYYTVEALTVVAPDDLTVLEASGSSTLTLITCHPFTYIGAAPNRFIVRAREINPPR